MEDYKKKYYEQSCCWDYDYLQNAAEKTRVEEIINNIPSDIHSVLDVGCGSGAFIDVLIRTFPYKLDRLLGLDSSFEALRHVKSEKIHGNINNLSFRNNSFDFVSCFEILEHLPLEEFRKGILELQRVSRKYIMITVPNNQDLEQSLVICPECQCWFNPYFHMRSFDKNILLNLFENFKLIKTKEIGPTVKNLVHNRLLFLFYHSWRKTLPPVTSICPQCGYQRKGEFKNLNNNKSSIHLSSSFLSLFIPLIKLISPIREKKRWLLALYEKLKLRKKQ